MSPTSTEHSAHGGGHNLVTHIRDLLPLPRHAVFHVKLVIHQLQSVPLISGEFRIKWKFKGLQTVNSAGRPLGLGRTLALKMDKSSRHVDHSHSHGKGKGKGKEVINDNDEHAWLKLEGATPTASTPVPHLSGRPGSSHSGQSSFHSNSKQSSSSSNSNSNSNSNSTSRLGTPPSNGTGIDYLADGRGHTPFLPLRDYNVDFEWPIDAAVQMTIERDTLALLPSELKLTVMQRVIPNDPEAPLKPRLGHVEVNLAEYADAGPVTRNYLLRRSKVNAMLNMTITVSHISGEDHYYPPPLRKEEIKAGISEFLSLNQTPLPALSRFMPTEDPWLSKSLNLISPPDDEPEEDPMENVLDVPGREGRTKKRWRVGANSKRATSAGPPKVADVRGHQTKSNGSSPRKQDLHPTEALIEAIFNPYPTTSVSASPFTYYVPPPPPKKRESDASEEHGTEGTSRGSFDSSRRASVSEQGHDNGDGGGNGNGRGGRWWRRKTGSRPVTPARTNSTRS